MTKINLVAPICLVGFTGQGKCLLGGAFQMADTHGFPLEYSILEAEKRGMAISIPHYFSSAIEHGWDDIKAFGKIREALVELGQSSEFEDIRMKCIEMFMQVAKQIPGSNAMEIAIRMRELIESDRYAAAVAGAMGLETGSDQA